MNARQLRELVIQPTLKALGMYSKEAEDLVLGTACQESHCGEYIRQLGCKGQTGAFGIYQMELATARDIYDNYLRYHPETYKIVEELRGPAMTITDALVLNLAYATAMCRIHYRRVKPAIPYTTDGQAEYWKKYYNTIKGKGTVNEYLTNYEKYNK